MKINRLPLRVELLVVLLVLLAPVVIGISHWQMSRALETQQQKQLDHLGEHGRGIQPLLLDLLASGRPELAERQLGQLADIHGIGLTLVLDNANRVIVGNRPGRSGGWTNRNLFCRRDGCCAALLAMGVEAHHPAPEHPARADGGAGQSGAP